MYYNYNTSCKFFRLDLLIDLFYRHQLFCLLTTRVVNKSVKHVERHMNGVKYKNALAECKMIEQFIWFQLL